VSWLGRRGAFAIALGTHERGEILRSDVLPSRTRPDVATGATSRRYWQRRPSKVERPDRRLEHVAGYHAKVKSPLGRHGAWLVHHVRPEGRTR
jgi:hypothetical protein